LLAGRGIPEAHGVVGAAGDKGAAVRAEGGHPDGASVAGEVARLGNDLEGPAAQSVVGAGRDELMARGVVNQGLDLGGVALVGAQRLAVVHVPEPHQAVLAAGVKHLAVAAEGGAGVAVLGVGNSKRAQEVGGANYLGQQVELNAVGGTHGQAAALGAEGDVVDADIGVLLFPVGRLVCVLRGAVARPEARGAVGAAVRQQLAVEAEGQRLHRFAEVGDRPMRVARGGLVEAKALVVPRGGQVLAVAAEGHAGNGLPLSGKAAQVLAGGRVPELDVLLAAGGGDRLAVGAEGDGADVLMVAAVGEQFAAAVEVPDLDGAVAAGAGEALAVGAEGDGADLGGVAQAQVAEDAGDVLGDVGALVRQLPAGLAKRLGGLLKAAGVEGGVGPAGQAPRPFHQPRPQTARPP